ncbi:MAG: glycoside hydrolase family 9 protein [Anaerocolumna sp.]
MNHRDFGTGLLNSKRLYRPLLLDESEFAETEIAAKAANKVLSLDNFTDLGSWSVDPAAKMILCNQYLPDRKMAIEFTSPTRFMEWKENYARIYHTPYLVKHFAGDDWTDYNRITVDIRPEMQGFKFVSIHLQIVNEGEHPIPDRYFREGCHNVNLKNQEWNHVSIEIPNVCRDQITALKFGYDMVGNENEATDTACFYINGLFLEKVTKPEKYKGWEPEENRILFCGTGYQPGAVKTAIAPAGIGKTFKLVDADSGRIAMVGDAIEGNNDQGKFAILDFSDIQKPGNYLILYGNEVTRTFLISDKVWEDSIWKTINLFFCERCGYEVPGVHKHCHGNVVNHHGDKSVVANGGWHDAADMSQCLVNTAEAVYSFFHTASQMEDNKELSERLIEEGKWGLEWMLKTRFGDGYRDMGSGTSVWTSGILGNCDQVDSDAQNLAIENFMAAAAEALAARVVEKTDKEQSSYLKQVAKEDWNFAYEKLDREEYVEALDPARVSSPILLYSAGVLAAGEIYITTGDIYFAKKAAEIAEMVMACQQKEYPDWSVKLTGFFYRDMEKTQIQHYNHRSHEHEPIQALSLLCRILPEHPMWIKWYHSVLLYTEYYKFAVTSTSPYYMSPASVYHIDEAKQDAELFLKQQAFAHPGMLKEYKEQIEKGVPLGCGYYLKRFPSWFSYRGNNGLVLAGGCAAAFGGRLRNDDTLLKLAKDQLEWVVGKNPFGQSLMMGEGYRYAKQYVCLPGEITGGICVGIQSYVNEDEPYWPQCSNAVYRELWVHPSVRYLLLSGQVNKQAEVYGWLFDAPGADLIIKSLRTKESLTLRTHPRTGEFSIELPTGEYEFYWQGMSKKLVLVNGGRYELTNNFYQLNADYTADKEFVKVKLTLTGKSDCLLEFRVDNVEAVSSYKLPVGQETEISFKILNKNLPWLITILPDGSMENLIEIYPKER